MAYEYIELNLIPTGEKPVFHAAQYDVGRPIIIKLKNGEDDFTPTDLDIELQVRKVDNNIVTAVPDSVDGNVVTFLSTQQMTACSGTNLCEVELSDGSTTIATLHFYLVVQRDVLAGGLTSQSEIYDLEEQIAAIVPEVIGDEYYTAEEVDEKIAEIPTFDPTNYYTKSQLYTKTETNGLLSQKANTSSLATVATSGSYNDLTNKPTIPDVSNYYTKSETYNQTEVNNLLSTKADTSSLSTVATTGDYDDLLNKPTIPAAQVQSDWSQDDNTKVDYIKNKPTIPTNAELLPISSSDPTNTKDYIDTGLSGKADTSDTYTKSEVDTIVAGRKCITYSLVTTSTLTGTDTTFNTFSGRKFSDYDLYIFTFGESATYMRRTAIVTKSQWVSGASVSEGVLHGSGSASASAYSYCGMVISYNSDTSVKGRVLGSEAIDKFSIIGIKY